MPKVLCHFEDEYVDTDELKRTKEGDIYHDVPPHHTLSGEILERWEDAAADPPADLTEQEMGDLGVERA